MHKGNPPDVNTDEHFQMPVLTQSDRRDYPSLLLFSPLLQSSVQPLIDVTGMFPPPRLI